MKRFSAVIKLCMVVVVTLVTSQNTAAQLANFNFPGITYANVTSAAGYTRTNAVTYSGSTWDINIKSTPWSDTTSGSAEIATTNLSGGIYTNPTYSSAQGVFFRYVLPQYTPTFTITFTRTSGSASLPLIMHTAESLDYETVSFTTTGTNWTNIKRTSGLGGASSAAGKTYTFTAPAVNTRGSGQAETILSGTTNTITYKYINTFPDATSVGSDMFAFRTIASLQGTVFNDTTPNDGGANGTGSNFGGLNAVLLNSSGVVQQVVPVSSTGTYTLTTPNNGNYTVQITTANPAVGSSNPAVILPAGYTSTNEDCCDNIGNDGTNDGKVSITVNNTSFTNINFGIAKTLCTEIIPPGNPTAVLTSSQYSFNMIGSPTDLTEEALITSISVVGEPNPFSELHPPNFISYQFANPSAGAQFVRDHGVTVADITDPPAVFQAAVLDANTDRDLRHYVSLDASIAPTDYMDFLYTDPIKSAGNRYVLVTERNLNNIMGIEALDINGNVIGASRLVGPTTHVNSNYKTDFNQDIGITVYPLTAIAPSGTEIHGVRLTQTGSGTATSVSVVGDGGDGKIFILYDPFTRPNKPVITSVVDVQPSTGNSCVGSITINATSNTGSLEYSINNGTSYQANKTFSNLAPGSYTIVVRVTTDTGCSTTYTGNNVILTNLGCTDSDGDGIPNYLDLDDDNDGILDTVEGGPICVDSKNTSMNTNGTVVNTPINTSQTQTPVVINGLGNGTFNFTGTLSGVAQWGSTANSGAANSSGGVQIKNNASIGDYIYLQPINTRTLNAGSVVNASPDVATYTLDFTKPVTGMSFISAGLNSEDTFEITAFNGATPVVLNSSNLSGFSPGLTPANWQVGSIGDGVKVVGKITTGGTSVVDNLFTTTISNTITKIVIRSYKNNGGSNATSTVTVGLTGFRFCTDGPFTDTDGDNIPDYLDLDSDNDGCVDAIEGDENVLPSQLVTAGGTVTTGSSAANQNLCATAGTTCIDAQGVPIRVNSGGSADIGGDQGQGIGSSTNSAINSCLDSDNDGIPDDIDLDDDNDGILDVNESCTGTNNTNIAGTVGFKSNISSGDNGTYPINGTTVTYVFDETGGVSFQTINLSGSGQQGPIFKSNAGSGTNTGVISQTFGKPLVNATFKMTDFDEQESVLVQVYDRNNNLIDLSSGVYITLGTQVQQTGNTFFTTASNSVNGDLVSSDPVGSVLFNFAGLGITKIVTTFTHVQGSSLRFTQPTGFCVELDTDGDGIPDYLDLDSDNDGCADAIEGSENVTAGQIHALNLPTTDANYPYRGQIKVIYNGTTVNSPANIVSTSTNALGVPQLVNNAGNNLNTTTNPTNLAGVADNTDVPATADIGQGIGSSANALISPCFIDAVNDINQVPKGVTATGNVLTNDESLSTPITVQSATYLNAAGVATTLPIGTATNVYDAAGTLAGAMTLNANGTYTFVPTATFVGIVPVKYLAVNSVGNTDPAELTIIVKDNPAGGNNTPIAQNDTGYTEMNTPVSSTVLTNDSDPDGNTLTVTGATTIPVGTATVVAGVDAAGNAVTNAGTITLNALGTYTYTPATGFVGTVNPIPYTISDGNSGTATAVINLTVLPNVGNNTFGNDDANTGIQGTTLTGNVLTNDTDPEANPTTVTAATVGGTALTIGTATVLPGVGTLTLNTNGTYTFVPLSTYVGTTSVVYTVCDTVGTPQACDTATLYLTELPLDPIDAVNDIHQVPQGVTAIGSVMTNDESTSNPVTVQSATYLNAAGVVTTLPLGTSTDVYDATGVLAGAMTLNASGAYTFVPTATFIGIVPVNYVAVNGVGNTDPAELTIVVKENPDPAGANNTPMAQNDTGYTEINTPVSSDVLNNDGDPDGNALTVTGATQGATTITLGIATVVSGVDAAGNVVNNSGSITLNADGTYTYTPATGFVGTVDPIPYTISDGNSATATAVINLTVLPDLGNNTFANDDANIGIQGTTLTGNVKTNDFDPEGNPQTIQSASANGSSISVGTTTVLPGAIGTIRLNPNGTYIFTPLPGYIGTTTVVYKICDNGNPQSCETATLYLTELPLGYCYENPFNGGPIVVTNHGITLLQRAGIGVGNWPLIRFSAHTVLESNTKGFVITRMTSDPAQTSAADHLNKITNPQDGMMVYDKYLKCLSIYSTTGATGVWSCFKTPACP